MQRKSDAERSCSSMVALGNRTKSGHVIFGKNSDRAVNEAQPLCYYPARDYPAGAQVECSFIRIPQVRHTFACIGSRPYVFFGFEHGINEHGVMIGNEAVSGRELPERRWGLIGMDILRLALERADTAAKAVEVMGSLLETYGTGGDPNYRIPSFNCNCIVADAKEAYLFESSQRCWVAKKVRTVGYLSNCYSIGEDYDLIGDATLKTAIEKGWVHAEQSFHAAKAFTRDDCLFHESEGFLRYARLQRLMEKRETFTVEMMMENLRDHYEGENYGQLAYGSATAKIPCICSHPGGISGCATAASAVAVIREDVPEPIRFTYWGSMAPPCCSIFRPYYNIGWLPDDLQNAHALYREEDQWWMFTELERYIALNYELFAPEVKEAFRSLEKEFLEQDEVLVKEFDGDAMKLKLFSAEASARSFDLAKSLIKKLKGKLRTKEIDRMLLDYFVQASDGCGMPYDSTIVK